MKIITTLSVLFVGLAAFAQSASMTIFNNGGQQFFVIMNGIRQNSIPQTNVKIGGMTTGSYEIKLIFADGKTGDINKKAWLETAGDYVMRVDIKGKKGKLKWFGIPGEGVTPAGGTNIQYRPNDQSVYSDQNVVANGSASGQYGTQSGQGSYGTQQTQNNGQATYQGGQGTYQQTGSGTMTTGTTITDPTMNGGQGGMNTNVVVTDQGMSGQSGGGQVGMNTNVVITDPTMNGSGSMQTTTTTSGTHPGTPMGTGNGGTNTNGQFGVNMNIGIVDPIENGGVGGVNVTTTANDGSGQPQTFGTSTTIVDPIENGGTGGVNMNAFGNGMPTGMTGTSTSSSSSTTTSSTTVTQNGQVVQDDYNYNQTSSNTQNGQTTTQTTQYGYSNGQPTGMNGTTTTTTYGTNDAYGTNGSYGNNGSYGSQGTMNTNMSTGTPAYTGGSYNCTTVLTDIDGFIEELNEKDFDADKRELIETDLKSKCVSADQAYRVINALTFESDRLDLSMFLYDRMTDKVNGKRLLELLDLDMNKEELKTYMKTH